MTEEEKRSKISNGSFKIQSKFEGRAYFLLNLMGIMNVIFITKLGGIYSLIGASVSFVAITAILIRSFFVPFLGEDARYRRAVLIFVCIIVYGIAIGEFILSL